MRQLLLKKKHEKKNWCYLTYNNVKTISYSFFNKILISHSALTLLGIVTDELPLYTYIVLLEVDSIHFFEEELLRICLQNTLYKIQIMYLYLSLKQIIIIFACKAHLFYILLHLF